MWLLDKPVMEAVLQETTTEQYAKYLIYVTISEYKIYVETTLRANF